MLFSQLFSEIRYKCYSLSPVYLSLQSIQFFLLFRPEEEESPHRGRLQAQDEREESPEKKDRDRSWDVSLCPKQRPSKKETW